MNDDENTFGWELAKYGDLLRKVLGSYPSFHDSAVRALTIQRARLSYRDENGEALLPGQSRDLVDVSLEILHNRYGPRPETGQPDYIVKLQLRTVRSGEIDLNAMLEEAWIRDITLTKAENGLVKFDLNPNIGLDLVLLCEEVIVQSIEPYERHQL
ncbi:Imm50 family immunity protein [Caballeronia sp. Lep1P3]|uniref:Imm50 family immunity protein n=1 Tax=Caballeronia sp. Lep1P3 TaxID=2878150 RepID=UPI001FD4BD0B|nr:Imm50 family immunity protein [Caballeronia sp. Lep1P3]